MKRAVCRGVRPAEGEGTSTAAVLWLMILLVFLPIAVAHGYARAFPPASGDAAAPGDRAPS